jgi:carbamoyl-phosphate synthase large subunit
METNNNFNILFTSVGRRVSLIRHFKKTIANLGLKGSISGTDITDSAPAFHVIDKAYKICRIDDPCYIDELIKICKQDKVKLVFPLIDTDLLKLSAARERFLEVGTNVVISDPELIKISLDKKKTHDFFVSANAGTPKIIDLKTSSSADLPYPLFIKPIDGNASKEIFQVRDQKELLFFKDYVSRPILQEHLDGTEYTLDLLFDFNSELRCVVPRKRIEIRAGEVSKGMVDCEEIVLDAGWKLGKKMKGARGCLNAQCFLSDDKTVKFVEINPRFGGGAPLSIHAGADFPRWIIEMNLGKDPGDISRAFKNNVLMLRYDDAIFVDG